MPPDPSVHVGVAGVVRRPYSGELLMVRRGGTGPFASDGYGTWSIPGGWLEYGEAPEEAVVREIMEETGVNAEFSCARGWVCAESAAAPVSIVTLVFECKWLAGWPTVKEPDKCPEVEWVPIPRLDELPLFTPLKLWRAAGHLYAS